MTTKKGKSVEETYLKLEMHEQVLLRPDSYIGSTEMVHDQEMWVLGESNLITKKVVSYNSAFIKIFDEILTNAIDASERDPTVTMIKVSFNIGTGQITVYNNGNGIPVVIHKDHKVYVPELVFGNFLAGSNYDDTEQRTGAGRNGIGSKATNVFSKNFCVETVDSDAKKKFVQVFSDNMTKRSTPVITNFSGKPFTSIIFTPDYPRFGMTGLDPETVAVISKKVYDCIICTNERVQVHLNGVKLKGKGLVDYMGYYDNLNLNSGIIIHERNNDPKFPWEYAVTLSHGYSCVSFVNGNYTKIGGRHVDCILNQIVSKLKLLIETKKKIKDPTAIKSNFIKDNLFIFVKATVSNPTFDSQMKHNFTMQVKNFGCSVPQVSDKFIEKLYKTEITERVLELCKTKETADLSKKTDGRKTSKIYIPKLDDAGWAGTAKSERCTLILTEGDSAKTFAMWGRSVLGTEQYGVFPLKGKCLNVRDATPTQLLNNEEINNLKKIIGLKHNTVYTDTKTLRYSQVMLLTDADVDGTHIRGLVINLFHYWWPELLKMGFFSTLRTPIVTASKGKKVIPFGTEQEYHIWANQDESHKKWSTFYYKGLGTWDKSEAKEIFAEMEKYKVTYYHKNGLCDKSLLVAFDKDSNSNSKAKNAGGKAKGAGGETDSDTASIVSVGKCADQRKEWLGNYNNTSYIKSTEKKVAYQDFVNKELIHFSMYDNTRSIPSLCDGLKPSQRKILYYMLNKNITNLVKVAQLSGYVSAETGYHHGEMSLQSAIIGLGANFIGSNNINLLHPKGNFGSALKGAKGAASGRYTYARLSDITRVLFDKTDDKLLDYLTDDGQQIEPKWYLPIIPMILVNGCDGIGTGYSTFVPQYNPIEIIANLVRLIRDKPLKKLVPWYRRFTGKIVEKSPGTFTSTGTWKRIGPAKISISCFPIGVWVEPYCNYFQGLIENGTMTKKLQLKEVENFTKDEETQVQVDIEFKSSEDLELLINSGTLEKELKLVKTMGTSNMYLFDSTGHLKKYSDPNEILKEFYNVRLSFYQKRKDLLISTLESEILLLDAKRRFVVEYISGAIQINKKSKAYVIGVLTERGYPLVKESFDYLINLPIVSLTLEKIQELESQCKSKMEQLAQLKKMGVKELWEADLERLLEKIE